MPDTVEVSVVMPCLNEEATIAECIRKAREGLARLGVKGEVVVADNGSTDGSVALAESLGARVVHVGPRGYGHAYHGGIAASRGRVIVIGDSDDTYDFSRLDELVRPLADGADLVLGSRLRGSIQPGAMPWLHRYVGNPFLSALLNRFYHTRISDTHSGFRAFTRDAYDRLDLRTGGMEFASEMLVAAAQQRFRIAEVPTSYHPRAGESKLRSFRDGWRHLRLLLLYSPTHLFTIPGLAMIAIGMTLLFALVGGPLVVGGRMFDYHFMFVGSLLAAVGTQVATLGLFARSHRRTPSWFTLERGLLIGGAAFVAGLAANAVILVRWIASGFGPLSAVRLAILALTLMVVGMQVLFSSFYLDLLRAGNDHGRSVSNGDGAAAEERRDTART
jgi:glycosyltransferase involved in cell wall biosynthesis